MMKPSFRIFSPRPARLAALLVCMQLALPVSAASLDDLLNAAKLGDAREVAQLVAKGMDPNSTDAGGNTLLILAAREDQPAVVAELLKTRGVKLDARNAAGDSALMLASLRGYTGVAEQLVSAGAPLTTAAGTPCSTPPSRAAARSLTCCWPRAPTPMRWRPTRARR